MDDTKKIKLVKVLYYKLPTDVKYYLPCNWRSGNLGPFHFQGKTICNICKVGSEAITWNSTVGCYGRGCRCTGVTANTAGTAASASFLSSTAVGQAATAALVDKELPNVKPFMQYPLMHNVPSLLGPRFSTFN